MRVDAGEKYKTGAVKEGYYRMKCEEQPSISLWFQRRRRRRRRDIYSFLCFPFSLFSIFFRFPILSGKVKDGRILRGAFGGNSILRTVKFLPCLLEDLIAASFVRFSTHTHIHEIEGRDYERERGPKIMKFTHY